MPDDFTCQGESASSATQWVNIGMCKNCCLVLYLYVGIWHN